MSKELDEIRRLFDDRLRGVATNTFYGEVVAVDEGKRTCKVKLGRVHAENVLLYGIEDESLKGWVLIPAKGSKVVVSRMSGSNRYYVMMFSEVEKVILTVGDQTLLQVTGKGFKVNRGSSGLKKTLTTLIDGILNLKFPTTSGATTGPTINAQDFIKAKNELNEYLED